MLYCFESSRRQVEEDTSHVSFKGQKRNVSLFELTSFCSWWAILLSWLEWEFITLEWQKKGGTHQGSEIMTRLPTRMEAGLQRQTAEQKKDLCVFFFLLIILMRIIQDHTQMFRNTPPPPPLLSCVFVKNESFKADPVITLPSSSSHFFSCTKAIIVLQLKRQVINSFAALNILGWTPCSKCQMSVFIGQL